MSHQDKSELHQFRQIIPRMLQDHASEEEIHLLQEKLLNDPQAREIYIDYMMVHGALFLISDELGTETKDQDVKAFNKALFDLSEYEKVAPGIEKTREEPQRELVEKVVYLPREKRKISKFHIATFIASAAAILFIVAFPTIFPPKTDSVEVATLTDQINVQWGDSDSNRMFRTGSRLYSNAGSHWLRKGAIKIDFDYGAEAIIEGPAEFELIDAEKIKLNSGRLYAAVPSQATGFTAVTPSSTIIDLGTEFGVKVDYDGSTDVHMFKGKASLVPGKAGKKGKGVSLLAGEAKSIDSYGTVNTIQLDADAFIEPDQYQIMSQANKGSAYHQWLLQSNELRKDPSLVAYYTFEKNEQRPDTLENKATLTHGKLDGDLYSATNGNLPAWTTGRWPHKTALSFDRSERQVVIVPGDPALHINGPITIAAWVKCDDTGDGGHIVSCRLPGRGEGNYQLGFNAPVDPARMDWNGKIELGRMSENDEELGLMNDRVFSDQKFELSDRWRFVVATHDNHVAKLYMDGVLIETHELEYYKDPVDADLVIGADDIPGDPLRFTGEMDELMIFKRVLTPTEISNIYKTGQS